MFNRFPVSGAPSGADEASPGAVTSCRSLLLSRPGVLTRRRAYTPLISSDLPAQQLLGAAQDGTGKFYAVWESSGSVLVGDTSYGLDIGAGAADRTTQGSIVRGNQDLLSFTEFVNGGGILFPTFPAVGCQGHGIRWLVGAPRCQDISLSSEVNATTVTDGTMQLGFTGGDGVAYRAVLGYDRTGSSGSPVTVMGAPSGRYVYVRPTLYTDFRVPLLRVRIPSDWPLYTGAAGGVPFNSYLYVYRSVPSLSHEISGASDSTSLPTDPAPSDTMQLVYKTAILSADISTGYIEFIDMCPPGGEGSPLYTNGGTNLEFTLPPACNSLATYKSTAFYSGITDRLVTTSAEVVQGPYIYGTGATTFVVASSVLEIPFPASSPLPTIVVGDVFSIKQVGGAHSGDYTVTGTPTFAGGNIQIPITGLANGTYTNCVGVCGSIVVTSGSTTWTLRLSLNSAATGAVDQIHVDIPSPLGGTGLGVSTASYIQLFAENISTGINTTCILSNENITASNLATGTLDTGALQIEFRPAGLPYFANLSILVNGTAGNPYDLTGRIFPLLPGMKTQVAHRLTWSPQGQPDCVQAANVLDVGSAEHEIMKLVSTRDTLYVFKSDGLWAISGDVGSFALTTISGDVLLLSPSAVDAYEDVVYCLTRQGVLQISGAAISNISLGILPLIEDALSSYVVGNAGTSGADPIVVIASAQERSLTVSIPQARDSSLPDLFAVFKYAFDTGAWTYSLESSSSPPNGFVAASEFPLMARPAIRVRGSRAVGGSIQDLLAVPVLRLAAGQPYSCHAQEQTSVADGLPVVITEPDGRQQPYEDDVTDITLTKIVVSGVTKYTFSTPLPSPEYDLTTAGILTDDDVLHALTNVVVGSVAGPPTAMLYTVQLSPNADTYDGQEAFLLVPPPVEATFAPIGDGVQAYNYNQAGILLSRRNSTKNYKFDYYFSDHSTFPYAAGSTASVSPTKPRTTPVAVERAGIPDSMTRGPRLTIKVSEAAPGERLELTELLVDFAPIAGEEIDYGN